MFVAIYSFEVRPGQNAAFEKAWHDLTVLIYQYENSLGSRLHKASDQKYVAYAQWPDKTTWANSGSNLPESANQSRAVMRASCSKIETVYELETTDDLLKTAPFTP